MALHYVFIRLAGFPVLVLFYGNMDCREPLPWVSPAVAYDLTMRCYNILGNCNSHILISSNSFPAAMAVPDIINTAMATIRNFFIIKYWLAEQKYGTGNSVMSVILQIYVLCMKTKNKDVLLMEQQFSLLYLYLPDLGMSVAVHCLLDEYAWRGSTDTHSAECIVLNRDNL